MQQGNGMRSTGLDLGKALAVEEVANGLGDLGAQADVVLQVGLSQIQIAIFHENLTIKSKP